MQKVTVLETESILISALEDCRFNAYVDTPEILTKISLGRCPFLTNLPNNYKGRDIKGIENLTNRVVVHQAAFILKKVCNL